MLLYQDSKAVPMISLLEKSLGDRTAVLLGERAAADTLILTPRTVSGREMLDAVCMPVGIDPEHVLVLAGGHAHAGAGAGCASQSAAAADAPAELRLAAQTGHPDRCCRQALRWRFCTAWCGMLKI